jgi:hypothetical protein
MGSSRGKDTARRKRPKVPLFTEKDRKIAFYSLIVLATVMFILALLAYSYAGSPSPLDLLHSENFRFSYTGTPTYTNTSSDHFYAGLNGISGTVTLLNATGESLLTLRPIRAIETQLRDGTTSTIARGEQPVILRSSNRANVSITVADEDEFNYNMRLSYGNPAACPGVETDDANNLLRIIRKSSNQYYINATFARGAKKMVRG